MLAFVLPTAPGLCSVPLFAAPPIRENVHVRPGGSCVGARARCAQFPTTRPLPPLPQAFYSALALLSSSLPMVPAPFGAVAVQQAPKVECTAVMAWLQLVLGCGLPILLESRATARLLQLHQRQRTLAHLAPERGTAVTALRTVQACLGEGGRLSHAALAWFALALAFELAHVLARSL